MPTDPLTSFRMSVSAISVLIADGGEWGGSITITNKGSASIFLGGSPAVTPVTGYEVVATAVYSMDLYPGDILWAVAIIPGQDIQVLLSLNPIPAVLFPRNLFLPSLDGIPQVGKRLDLNVGTWTGEPQLRYVFAWQRSGDLIVWDTLGADLSMYYPYSSDVGYVLRASVVAINRYGASEPSFTSGALTL